MGAKNCVVGGGGWKRGSHNGKRRKGISCALLETLSGNHLNGACEVVGFLLPMSQTLSHVHWSRVSHWPLPPTLSINFNF